MADLAPRLWAWGHAQRERLFELQRGTCYLCRGPMRRGPRGDRDAPPATLDHIVPRALGGTDDEANLALACKPCNRIKGDLTLAGFIGMMAAALPAPARSNGWPGGGAGRCRKPAAEADGAPRDSGASR